MRAEIGVCVGGRSTISNGAERDGDATWMLPIPMKALLAS